MPTDIAKVWANRMLTSPGAIRDVEQLIDEAVAFDAQATLIVAPELMTNGKGCLVRWTGNELVVVELTAEQQRSLGVLPAGLSKILEPRPVNSLFPPVQSVTLADMQIDNAERHDGHQRLTGTCTCSFDDAQTYPLTSCALQVQYVRPDLACQLTSYQHFNAPLIPPRCELRFSFSPIFSKFNPVVVHKTVVLFLQLLIAQDWRSLSGCRCVSNAAAATINLL